MCAYPDIPVPIFAQRKHHIVRQPIMCRVGGERRVLQARHTAAIRADPEAPVPGGKESHDIDVYERGRIRRVEHSEADTVEPYQAGLRREPEVPVGSLGDGLDRVLRQPILHQPGRMRELREGLCRIEGERLCRAQERQRDECNDISYDLHS